MTEFLIRCWAVSLCLALLAVPAVAADDSLRLSVDRVTVRPSEPKVVNLFVTVTDRNGETVAGLEAFNFDLREDGLLHTGPLTVKPFGATGRRIAWTLVMDHREDLTTSLTTIRNGATDFIERMGFRNQGAVATYTGEPRVAAGPTGAAPRLVEALIALPPASGTPRLADGLLLGLDTVEKIDWDQGPPPDRRVLVLLTDGMDQGSLFSLDAAMAKADESSADFFVIGYGVRKSEIFQALADLADRKGGRSWFETEPGGVQTAFNSLAERLENQYVFSFPPDHVRFDGGPHRVEIHTVSKNDSGSAEAEFVAPLIKAGPGPWIFAPAGGLLLLLVLVAIFRIGKNKRRQKAR
jgi:hypothetical protein